MTCPFLKKQTNKQTSIQILSNKDIGRHNVILKGGTLLKAYVNVIPIAVKKRNAGIISMCGIILYISQLGSSYTNSSVLLNIFLI